MAKAESLKSKVEKYLERAKPLFASLRQNPKLGTADSKKASGLLDAAMRYYSDAKHFYAKKEYVNALAALEYAEGWMDAGKEIGLLE